MAVCEFFYFILFLLEVVCVMQESSSVFIQTLITVLCTTLVTRELDCIEDLPVPGS